MMRQTAISVVLVACLVLPAAAASSLPPGRPAGSKRAALTEQQIIFIGAGVLVAGEYKIQGGDSPTPPAPPPNTTPTTTTR